MTRSLSVGTSGEDVRNLQKLLNFHLSLPRPRLATDGVFGHDTDRRVQEFQRLNRLGMDGIVGPQTRRALLDVRTVTSGATIRPTSQAIPARGASVVPAPSSFVSSPSGLPPVPPFQLPVPPLLQPQPGPFKPPAAPSLTPPAFAFTLQAGSQVAFNPWFISPLVVTAQMDILLRNDGRPPFTISVGGQGALNTSILNGTSPGAWTGQGFIQLGPNIASF